MNTLSYKTISASKTSVKKSWVIVDVKDQVLGRVSSKIAYILRGKNKPYYTPHADCGDNVIVINADKIKITGAKWTNKHLLDFSGYPGGQKKTTPLQLLRKKPAGLVERTVKGMLPKTILGREIYRNLYVYAGSEHPHQAQNPITIDINKIK